VLFLLFNVLVFIYIGRKVLEISSQIAKFWMKFLKIIQIIGFPGGFLSKKEVY